MKGEDADDIYRFKATININTLNKAGKINNELIIKVI